MFGGRLRSTINIQYGCDLSSAGAEKRSLWAVLGTLDAGHGIRTNPHPPRIRNIPGAAYV